MISLQPRRDEAIEAGWIAYSERVPGMRDAYLQACNGWAVEAVCSGDQVIGALYSKSGFIHLGIVPEWRGRWASRRVLREMLKRGTKTEIGPGDDAKWLARIKDIV